MRKAVLATLIIISILFSFQFFVRPSIVSRETVEDIDEDELIYMGEYENGSEAYLRFKKEVKDWTEMLKGLVPILSLVVAHFLRKKK